MTLIKLRFRDYFQELFNRPKEDILFFLWVYSCLLHYFEQPVKSLSILIVFSLVLIFVRVSINIKILFILIYTITILNELPKIANHTVLALFINIAILYEYTKNYFSKKKFELFSSLGKYIYLLLIIIYFFSVFHKLNSGYFDVNFSCATSFYQKMRGGMLKDVLPDSLWVYTAVIYFSLIVEFLIFLGLLLFPRRVIAVAFLFHGILSFYVFYDFAAILFFCFYLLLQGSDENSKSRMEFGALHFFLFLTSLVPLILVNFFKVNTFFNPHTFAALFLIIGYFLVLFSSASCVFFQKGINRGQAFLLAVFLFNCITPYLGIKTTSNFSMFSNLRVEGDFYNHLIAQKSWQLFGHTSDLVWIEHAIGPQEEWITTPNLGLPFKELQRVATEIRLQKFPVFELSYTRNGDSFEFKNAIVETQKIPNLSLFELKLLGYRTIRKDGIAVCQW